MGVLTKETIEVLVERAADWPDAAQEELVRSINEIEQKHVGMYRLTDDERADLEASLEEIARGEVASDKEVAALFNKYR